MNEEFKITIPLITETELERIDNNLHEVVNDFIKTTVKDKELFISQHIIKRLEEENKQLKQENIDLKKTIKVNEKSRRKIQQSLMKEKDKSKKILDELEKWLNEKWECPGSKIYIGEIVKEIQDLKGEDNED